MSTPKTKINLWATLQAVKHIKHVNSLPLASIEWHVDDYDGGYPVTNEVPAEGLSNSEYASDTLARLMEDWQNPEYCVSARGSTPYRNRDNYTCNEWEDIEVLKSGTIEGLYEKMAKFKINHKLKAGTPDRRGVGSTCSAGASHFAATATPSS